MEKYILIVGDGKITIQEAEYIEDGFYIEVIGREITLYEVPLFGGKPDEIGKFKTIIEAVNKIKTLT